MPKKIDSNCKRLSKEEAIKRIKERLIETFLDGISLDDILIDLIETDKLNAWLSADGKLLFSLKVMSHPLISTPTF